MTSAPRLVFATTNKGKLAELKEMASGLTVLSLADFPGVADVDEDQATLEGNAVKKALFYAQVTGALALADDSGLCVDALGGRPGVHSARYAPGTDDDRISKLLEEMKDVPQDDRRAWFRCALCLASPGGKIQVTHGACEGQVLRARQGTGGFGYDPVLWVPALGKSMGELTREEKASISHRGRAFASMRPFLDAAGQGHWP